VQTTLSIHGDTGVGAELRRSHLYLASFVARIAGPTAIFTNWDQRDDDRNIRPLWCWFASASKSCLGTNLSICETIVLQAWFRFVTRFS